jgi:hypothetical protein
MPCMRGYHQHQLTACTARRRPQEAPTPDAMSVAVGFLLEMS